jgi:hypothetical protein
VVVTALCAEKVPGGIVMANGDATSVGGVPIEAVPAYNIKHKRPSGEPFHPPGHGNGYVLTFGDTRVYVAGDTEDVPEMANLAGVDCAFLPMNLPYTMTPKMVANAAKILKPRILYPYHFGDTDTSKLVDLLKDFEDIDSLLSDFQLRRIKRRVGNVLESEDELKAAAGAVKQGGSENALASAIALIEEFTAKGILDKIDVIETRLVNLQVGLLGRPVHSQEHWQYLRELAFKYPVSPVMCCIRRLNDRYMVVPRWDSEITGLLRDFLGRASANPA